MPLPDTQTPLPPCNVAHAASSGPSEATETIKFPTHRSLKTDVSSSYMHERNFETERFWSQSPTCITKKARHAERSSPQARICAMPHDDPRAQHERVCLPSNAVGESNRIMDTTIRLKPFVLQHRSLRTWRGRQRR